MSRLPMLLTLGYLALASAGLAQGDSRNSESFPVFVAQQSSSENQQIQKVEHELLTSKNKLGQLLEKSSQRELKKPAPKSIDLRPPGTTPIQKTASTNRIHSENSSLFSNQLVGHRAKQLPPSTTSRLATQNPANYSQRMQSGTLNQILAAKSSTTPASRSIQQKGNAQQNQATGTSQIYTAPYSSNPLRGSINNRYLPPPNGARPPSISLTGPGKSTSSEVVKIQATNRQSSFHKESQSSQNSQLKTKSLSGIARNHGHSSMKVSGKKLVSRNSVKSSSYGTSQLKLSDPRHPRPLGEVITSPNLDADFLELEEFSTKREDNLAADPSLSEEDIQELSKKYARLQENRRVASSISLDQKTPIKVTTENAQKREYPVQQASMNASATSSRSGSGHEVIHVSGEFGPSFLDLIFDLDQLGTGKQQLSKRLGTPKRTIGDSATKVVQYAEQDGLTPHVIYQAGKLKQIEFRLKRPEVWSTTKNTYGLNDFPARRTKNGHFSLSEINLVAVPMDNINQANSAEQVVIEKIVFIPGLRERVALEDLNPSEIASITNTEKPITRKEVSKAKKTTATPASSTKPVRPTTPSVLAYDMKQSRLRISALSSKFGNSGLTVLEEVHYHNLRREFHLASKAMDRLDPQFLDTNGLLCYYFEQATCGLGRQNVEAALTAISELKQLQIDPSQSDIKQATVHFLEGRLLCETPKAKKVFQKNCQQAVARFRESIKTLHQVSGITDPNVRRMAGILFVMNHAHLGKAISLGPYNDKEKVSKLWYQHANALSFKMQKRRTASPVLQMATQKVAVDAAIQSGDLEKIQLCINNLHSQFADIRFKLDSIDRDILTLWLAEDYYYASFHNFRTGNLTQATRLHRQSERFLKVIEKVHSAEQKTWLNYCLSRNHWLKGAIAQKSGKPDAAARWFNKSLQTIPSKLTSRINADQAEQGERYANMAVTFWNQKQHQKAIDLTGKGLELIQECVSLGRCSASRMVIPESNLVQMQTDLALQKESSKKVTPVITKPVPNETKSSNIKTVSTMASKILQQPKPLPPAKKKTAPATTKPKGPVPIIQASDVPASAWRPKN